MYNLAEHGWPPGPGPHPVALMPERIFWLPNNTDRETEVIICEKQEAISKNSQQDDIEAEDIVRKKQQQATQGRSQRSGIKNTKGYEQSKLTPAGQQELNQDVPPNGLGTIELRRAKPAEQRESVKQWLSRLDMLPPHQNSSLILPNPIDILGLMLKRTEELYPARYEVYLKEKGKVEICQELQSLLLPEAWEIFQHKDYSRER